MKNASPALVALTALILTSSAHAKGCPHLLAAEKEKKQGYVPSLSTNYDYLKHVAEFDKEDFPQKNVSRIEASHEYLPDTEFAAQLRIKEKLLAHDRARIFKNTGEADFDLASRELLDQLVDELPRFHPDYFVRDGGFLVNKITGKRWNVVDLEDHPLVIAGQLVPEDLILNKKKDDGKWYLAGGFLAFPSEWSLNTMMGKSMEDVHEDAAMTDEGGANLMKTINGILNSNKAGNIYLRNNWLLWTNPSLAAPDYHHFSLKEPKLTLENIGDELYLRIERQTLRRLPKSGYVVFALRPYVYPMREVKKHPDVVQKLLGGLGRLKKEQSESSKDFHEVLVEYLSRP
jgi:hypothetical protein